MFATVADTQDFPLVYGGFVFCAYACGNPFFMVFQSTFIEDFITDLVKT